MYLACLSVVGNHICIRNATSAFSGNFQARSSYIRKLWEMFSDTAIINTLKLVRGFHPKRYKWLIFFIKKCRFCPFFFTDLRYKVPDSQFKWIHFLESEQKYGMKCLLSKNAFKTKIKQTLSEILASEDCYIDLPEIVEKVKLIYFPLS